MNGILRRPDGIFEGAACWRADGAPWAIPGATHWWKAANLRCGGARREGCCISATAAGSKRKPQIGRRRGTAASSRHCQFVSRASIHTWFIQPRGTWRGRVRAGYELPIGGILVENTEQAREAPRRSRRHFVAAGAAAAAAAMAGFASSKDAEAAAGDPLVLGADGSVNQRGHSPDRSRRQRHSGRR